jgi:hemoglobin/transferrin/lactoferrin receptor protein
MRRPWLSRACEAVAAVVFAASTAMAAATSGDEDLTQVSLEELLRTPVVTASRHPQRHIDAPRSVSIITAAELRRRNCRTVPEALNQVAGVLVQETNYVGGSPIIRGLIGNQILLLLDGVRLNNAIYRLGPNQYLNLIDINQVEQIEVVRGNGSVLYGSDALGGVVNIITKSRNLATSPRGIQFRTGARLSSADRGATGRLEFGAGTRCFGLNGGLSLKSFGDLRGGKWTGLQTSAGYHELDGDLKLQQQFAPNARATFAVQRVAQSHVPRTDVLRAGTNRQYEWDPQERTLMSLSCDFEPLSSFVRSVRVGTSYQDHDERIRRIETLAPNVQRRYRDRVLSNGYTLQLSSALGTRQALTYGSEFYRDRVNSSRVDLNLLTGVETPKPGTFANGARYASHAFYVQDEIRVIERWSVNLGLRHSRYRMAATIQDLSGTAIVAHYTPYATTGSLHSLFRLAPEFHLIGGIAQGFRSPNLDDISAIGNFGGGFEVPNSGSGLAPEQSLDYELGVKVQRGRAYATAFGFLSELRDIIQRQPGTYEGLSFLDYNDNLVQDSGEPDVYERQNTGLARIVGAELEAQVPLREGIDVYGNFGWTRGDDRIAGQPLRRIPPPKGVVGSRWQVRRNLWLDLHAMFAGIQDRLAPGDLTDPRIPVGGTPGFATFDLSSGIELNGVGTISLALENLTDASYRLHGSGIDGPGFNLVLGFQSYPRP